MKLRKENQKYNKKHKHKHNPMCCECTLALSSVLSVWISSFHLCTHICSFLRFLLPLRFSPCVFSLARFLVCFVCACSWDTWVARPSVAGSFLYSGVWRRTYASVKSIVKKVCPVSIIYLCILVKDNYYAVC